MLIYDDLLIPPTQHPHTWPLFTANQIKLLLCISGVFSLNQIAIIQQLQKLQKAAQHHRCNIKR